MGKFERWTKKTYSPKIARWKRPALFILSITIGFSCAVAAYFQINQPWTNDGVWWVIGLFGLFSLLGFLVSLFAKDYWVALILGDI